MPKVRVQRLAVLWVVAAVFCLQFIHAAAHCEEARLTPEDEAALAAATALSRANIAIAKIIRPAVVHIKVERRVTLIRDFNDPFEYFSEMFGQRFPGQPRAPRTQAQTETRIGQGSGVIIDSKGYILTNNHVVGEADAIQVSLLDGREFTAELIGADPSSDVAVIKINADSLTVANIGDSDLVEVGEMVMAVGNPFGLDFTVTSGIVSARGRSGMGVMEIEDFIQTDASINPGNSGGPLVNLKGEVIGINSFIYTRNDAGRMNGGANVGVGFAIPSNMAKSIMQSLISHKQVTNSYLGVETQTLTQELALGFGLKSPRGALIQAVTKGSPADRAGLRRGDVVVRWGKREINDDRQFRNLVTVTPPDQPVDVEVMREGQTVMLSVTLVALTPEMVIARGNDRFLQGFGIIVDDLNPRILAELGYPADTVGALVTGVHRGSPADSLGFRNGSIILSVNGKLVRETQELRTILAAAAASRTKTYELVWMNGDFVSRATISVN